MRILGWLDTWGTVAGKRHRRRAAFGKRQLAAYIAQYCVGRELSRRGATFTITYNKGDEDFTVDTTCIGAVRDAAREADIHIGPHGFRLKLEELPA